MAALDFPANPTLGQEYSANGVTFRWDGSRWVRAPFTGEPWVRPSDWLPLPSVTGQQKFVGLLAIHETSNFCALVCAGNYTVDWGDGSAPENITANIAAEHQYAWGDISSTTLCSRGYRQVIVTVTPQAGQNLTSVNLNQTHSALPGTHFPEFLDVAFNGASLDTIICSSMPMLEQVSSPQNVVTSFNAMFDSCYALQSVPLFDTSAGTDFSSMFSACHALRSAPTLDTSSGAKFNYMFDSCYALQSVPLFDTSSGTNFSYMFNHCYALQSVPLFDTSAGTDFGGMFTSCYALQSVPLFDTSSGTNFSYMFDSCYALQSVPLFDTSAGTDFSSMFYDCRALRSAPTLDTSSGTNFSYMFGSCYALQSVPLLDVSAGTDFRGMFEYCHSLKSVEAVGFSTDVSFASTLLSGGSIDDIYTSLPTVSGKTITVAGTYGAGSDDPTIATAKGWTVVG